MVGEVQKPQTVAQAQVTGELLRADTEGLAKLALEPPTRGAGARRQLIHRQRLAQMLLENRHGTTHDAVLDAIEDHRLGLGVVAASVAVQQHDVQALACPGASQVALHQIGRQVRRRSTTGTGQAVAIVDIEAVGHRADGGKTPGQIQVVVPADAATPPLHHTGLDQRVDPGAHPHQRHAQRCRMAQIVEGAAISLGAASLESPSFRARSLRAMSFKAISFLAFPQHPADNHQVVELAGITERLPMTAPYRLAGRDHRTTA